MSRTVKWIATTVVLVAAAAIAVADAVADAQAAVEEPAHNQSVS